MRLLSALTGEKEYCMKLMPAVTQGSKVIDERDAPLIDEEAWALVKWGALTSQRQHFLRQLHRSGISVTDQVCFQIDQ